MHIHTNTNELNIIYVYMQCIIHDIYHIMYTSYNSSIYKNIPHIKSSSKYHPKFFHNDNNWVLFFFLCGGKEIIHCFRNIFRNPSATTAPASATCISHITLPRASATLFSWVFASATTAPLRFPRFLVVVGFISFHFGLLGLHLLSFLAFLLLRSVVLGLDFARALAGSTVVWACVPSAVLPRSFRAASAKHRSKTGNQTRTA